MALETINTPNLHLQRALIGVCNWIDRTGNNNAVIEVLRVTIDGVSEYRLIAVDFDHNLDEYPTLATFWSGAPCNDDNQTALAAIASLANLWACRFGCNRPNRPTKRNRVTAFSRFFYAVTLSEIRAMRRYQDDPAQRIHYLFAQAQLKTINLVLPAIQGNATY